jgi:potassium efflux system protein
MKDPEPIPIFTAFGSSSLDFRLLFWITDNERRLMILSDLAVMINAALKKAGITIPFPQQDLHVKTVDQSITDQLIKGRKAVK